MVVRHYVLAVAVPTLIGSLLSCIASGMILLCYMVLPPKSHLRHVLIINLALADFINSANNSVSGIIVFKNGGLQRGSACTFNGWLGQFSVQATDFSVLFIAILTVLAFKRPHWVPRATTKNKVLLTMAIWFVPLITSLTGLGLDDYTPVSGNWCWLSPTRPGLRYALGHGWRFAIVAACICLYTTLYIHLHDATAHIRDLTTSSGTGTGTHHGTAITVRSHISVRTSQRMQHYHESTESDSDMVVPLRTFDGNNFESVISSEAMEKTEQVHKVPAPIQLHNPKSMVHHQETDLPSPSSPSTITTDKYTSLPPRRSTISKKKPVSRSAKLQKLLLLNAYPIAYIILWIPGLTNRVLELTGRHVLALNILQSSTQYVGLANAITYGWTELLRRDLKAMWRDRRWGRERGRGRS